MQNPRLEQTYPGDSLKVMWRGRGRATWDQTQGSSRTLCPSRLSLGVKTGGQLHVYRCRKDCSCFDTEVSKEGAGSEALWGQQGATLWRYRSPHELNISRSWECKTQKAPGAITMASSMPMHRQVEIRVTKTTNFCLGNLSPVFLKQLHPLQRRPASFPTPSLCSVI